VKYNWEAASSATPTGIPSRASIAFRPSSLLPHGGFAAPAAKPRPPVASQRITRQRPSGKYSVPASSIASA
jgi:hypothetical protein